MHTNKHCFVSNSQSAVFYFIISILVLIECCGCIDMNVCVNVCILYVCMCIDTHRREVGLLQRNQTCLRTHRSTVYAHTLIQLYTYAYTYIQIYTVIQTHHVHTRRFWCCAREHTHIPTTNTCTHIHILVHVFVLDIVCVYVYVRLSGGAYLGFYHVGVAKTLWKEGDTYIYTYYTYTHTYTHTHTHSLSLSLSCSEF